MNSDKTLAVLLIVAIVVAVAGIYLNLTKLQQISGFASSGNVSVNITRQVSITLTDSTCDFGQGYVTAPYAYAELYFNGTQVVTNNWTATSAPTPPGIVVRNDGNVDIYVCVSPSKNESEFFGGGTSSRQFYGFWVSEKETGSCGGGRPFNYAAEFLTKASQALCEGITTVQQTLKPQDQADEVYVNCYLKISDDTPPGLKNDTWMFTAQATSC